MLSGVVGGSARRRVEADGPPRAPAGILWQEVEKAEGRQTPAFAAAPEKSGEERRIGG